MNVKTSILALALIALTTSPAMPQFFDGGGGGGDSKPWSTFRLNPKTRVKLGFRNATIDNILAFFQKQSGVTIVKDPGLTGTLSLSSAKPVSLSDAFQILSTTLSLKKYDLKKQGNMLVVQMQQARPSGPPTGFTFPPDFEQPQPVLKVYQIKYASASAVARTINEVFTPNGGGGFQLPFGGFGGNNRFGGGGGRFGQGGFPGFGRNNNNNQPSVRASSDDFSNSVIVNAPSRDQTQVESLISQIDKETDTPQVVRVYPLKFAAASELVPVVQSLLTANAPTGRGGLGAIGNPGNPFGQQFARMGAASSQVSADTRTNSVVVTATEDNQKIISEVVSQLDTDVPVLGTTFVFPLANARADDVATLLNNAFGTRQGGGNNRTNNVNRGNNNNNNNRNGGNNRGGTGGSNNFGGSRRGVNDNAVEQDPNSIAVQLEDPNAEQGELMTSVGVVQGGPFQFFGGQQRNQNQNQRATGRDANGQIVNVADPTGQVTVISDPNTNSLIVVSTPDNADVIRNILEQLDRIPEQVMIETLIVEANLTNEDKFGIDWKLATPNLFGNTGVTGTGETNFGVPRNTPFNGDGLRYSITGGNLQAYINLFQSSDRFHILSTPRIFTSNNSQAEINISQSVPYVINSTLDTLGNERRTYSFLDVGIVLTVTPRITANGMVAMDVTQTANDLVGFQDVGAPIVNQRQADTTVSVKDGETIILGGIIRDSVTSNVRKIPLLGDIPILGNLFRSTSKSKDRTELMVFLTPHVVRNPEEAKALRERQEKQLAPGLQKTIDKTLPVTPPKTSGGTNKGDNG